MANQIPIKQHTPEPGLAEFETGDTIGIANGGTGQTTAGAALTALGGAPLSLLTAVQISLGTAQTDITNLQSAVGIIQSDITVMQGSIAATQGVLTNHINDTQIHVNMSTINGETMPTFLEPVRAKQLSVSMSNFLWAEAGIGNNEWIQVAHAVDTLSGHHMPFDGTIVGFTAQCEDANGNSKNIRLYINGTEVTVLGTVTGTDDVFVRDVTTNIDFNQDDKIRLRGGGGGTIADTVLTLLVRWRG